MVDFPFADVAAGASVDIYHGAHGRWETYAPVRTMAIFDIGEEPHVLAAYTCTPLVTFPVAGIHDEAKLEGRTVAELGNRNRPLDMVVYQKGGHNYALMANSSRGVMKVDLGEVASVAPITDRVADKAGLGYTTLSALEGVQQLDRYNDSLAVLLVQNDDGMNLQTIDLP